MTRLWNPAKALLVVFGLYGCSTPYYGYSKLDWNRLAEEHRVAIRETYQPIIEKKRNQKHQDLIDARTQSVIDLGVYGRKY